jgi:FkbM family methyltransferase
MYNWGMSAVEHSAKDGRRRSVPVDMRGGPEELTLPNGRTVACVNRHNAAGVWHEISGMVADWPLVGLRGGDTVIDVGAHIGLAALAVADRKPGVRVIACEPAPPSYLCLRHNLATHLPGSTALDVAVGAARGTGTLTFYPNIETMSTVHVDEDDDQRNVTAALVEFGVTDPAERLAYWTRARAGATSHPVRVTTVSQLVAAFEVPEVALLKIDVERAEHEVLRGIDEHTWPRIRAVVAEVHDLDGRLARTVALLAGHGFDVRHFQPDLLTGASVHMVLARRG